MEDGSVSELCSIIPHYKIIKDFIKTEKPFIGIVKYSDGIVDVGNIIGYRPNTECEFIIEYFK